MVYKLKILVLLNLERSQFFLLSKKKSIPEEILSLSEKKSIPEEILSLKNLIILGYFTKRERN